MQILPLLVAILLGISALAFVLYPLYRLPGAKAIVAEAPIPSIPMGNDQEQAEWTARSALQEVELDFQLGNLAESDYRVLRDRYMKRAYVAAKVRSRNTLPIGMPNPVVGSEQTAEPQANEDLTDADNIDEAIEAALRKMKEETLPREAQQ